mgnify:CR=1 FL=1
MRRFFLAAFFFMLLSELHSQKINFIKDSLVSYIENGIQKWNVPGLGILVIKDGEVVIKRGFGYRNLEQKIPFDAETSFFIASNTKLFTSTMISNLALQGKLAIDDRVRKYFPSFQLNSPANTQLVILLQQLLYDGRRNWGKSGWN